MIVLILFSKLQAFWNDLLYPCSKIKKMFGVFFGGGVSAILLITSFTFNLFYCIDNKNFLKLLRFK